MAVNVYLSAEERAILEAGCVGIAGAGGLGSNCAAHLVRAGVRHLVIADFDVVAESNLNRQFYFRDQLGQKKVDALRDNLLRIAPDLRLDMYDVILSAENIRTIFAPCDIIGEAFDDTAAKTMLFEALVPTAKKLVLVSGIAGWGRSNAITLNRIGRNLLLIGDQSSGVAPSAGLFPASPRVGIAAAMQANSIVAWLLGREV